MTRASGIGQGPAKGAGTTNLKKPLEISKEKQSLRARTGWLKRKMRAYSYANPDSRINETAPSRLEIAELAQRGMPEAIQALELIIHRSRSDVARVQAFLAFKQAAYGNDRLPISVKMDFDGLSDAALKVAIAAELGISPDQIPD